MKQTADELIADAVGLEDSIDKTDIGPVWAQAAIAMRLGELNETVKQTNRLLAATLVMSAGGPLAGPTISTSVAGALGLANDILKETA